MSKSKSNKYEGLRYPPLNDLIDKVHNKYELVLATSKRARELVDGAIPFIKYDVENPISIATEEIDEGVIQLDNPALSEKNPEVNIEERISEEETLDEEILNEEVSEDSEEEEE